MGEFIGTLMLVLIGCGSVVAIGTSGPSFVQIGLTFGLVVATMAQVSFDKQVLCTISVSLWYSKILSFLTGVAIVKVIFLHNSLLSIMLFCLVAVASYFTFRLIF